MISFAFIAIAAIFNAIMDALENENFYESIFRNHNPRFWYKRESWKYAAKMGGYKFDSWHLAKSLMIVALCIAVVNYEPVFGAWIDFLIAGAIWNTLFVTFYHGIFKVK